MTGTKLNEMPEEIFVEPYCCQDPSVGQLWCDHDPWSECEDGRRSTKYIRADLTCARPSERQKKTYHQIALMADQRSKDYRSDGMAEASEALGQFAEDLWLRINDFDIPGGGGKT